jgi:hypothetical protein
MWYVVNVDIAYIAIAYLNAASMTGIEYITKHYTEQSINDKRFIHYSVKNND